MYDWRKMTDRERREVLAARKATCRHWHRPPHIDCGQAMYHITAACFEHRPVIGGGAGRMAEFQDGLLISLDDVDISVHAWCVLPNHYHLLAEANSLKTVSTALGAIHGRTSHVWNGEDHSRGRRVWHSFSDRSIRTERHLWATVNYIHNNSVHHRYVTRWSDWPLSSATAYLKAVGRDEAERVWREYPVMDYGKGWDDPNM